MPATAGPLASRRQALAQLRQVAEFFRRTEPHSPVAYLADKAARWGEMPLHVWLKRVIKDDATLAQMQEMLRGVVTDGSLGAFADLPGEPVIGKTGTAEWTSEDGELKLHSWVIVAQGDLVVAAFVEDGSYGSVTAGPIAREVLEGL